MKGVLVGRSVDMCLFPSSRKMLKDDPTIQILSSPWRFTDWKLQDNEDINVRLITEVRFDMALRKLYMLLQIKDAMVL